MKAALLALILVMGCVQQGEVSQIFVEKTALLTMPNIDCSGQEAHAYIQFIYQENGALKYVNTDTTCQQLGRLNEKPSMGEQITISFVAGKPIRVRREYGSIYDVKISLQNTNFFDKEINVIEQPSNLPFIAHPDDVIVECKLLSNEQEHDTCLATQAAVHGDDTLCDQLAMQQSKDSCHEWLGKIDTLYK